MTAVLSNRRIVLGVSGGIAAYKSCELVRRLRLAGAQVRVVMTAAASAFVTPLTFQALSGQPVHQDLLDPGAEAAMGHIELARWADAVLVAPATADTLARFAQGRADDLLATLCLATTAPLALAPAMNHRMWAHPATQANRAVLESRGVRLWGPAAGDLACGEVGDGRMLEPDLLVERLVGLFAPGTLQGLTVLVTAGPTREPLDPVRFLSNRSSGKMGYAVARAAAEAGARVILVSGPVACATPDRVERIDVESAAEMQAAVLERVAAAHLYISAAAVADYTPVAPASGKLKKGRGTVTLPLAPAPDILRQVAALAGAPFTVGFAAETERLVENARAKRMSKGLDMVAANWVGGGRGFDAEDNALEVVWEGGGASLPAAPKERLARQLIALIAERYHAKKSTTEGARSQDRA
ncbi:MAG: bifunctional 4'-phosphopantothenoylcysteine decarboxylase/phosphopantothenoylcysteine synthetase [Chromatiales bacterium 21-64-14]|nr:MAG: bifunctional 4'-phosphopantothenoylcysteine decarboxylase/phosphopantothenoylcysteine synthetase [Chromatiales bacterium 21-64-14]HQU15756.1 bifunctional phosphopantothenoylcysteine decarboxylase/phosphopantothenate--cysteine ligase CoaBC [Gammaproteobacteria bacterium]